MYVGYSVVSLLLLTPTGLMPYGATEDTSFKMMSYETHYTTPKIIRKETTMSLTKESADLYAYILCMVGNNHRVIRCRDDIQFILQQSYPSQWKSKSFHTGVDSLLRVIADRGLTISQDDIQKLYDYVETKNNG